MAEEMRRCGDRSNTRLSMTSAMKTIKQRAPSYVPSCLFQKEGVEDSNWRIRRGNLVTDKPLFRSNNDEIS